MALRRLLPLAFLALLIAGCTAPAGTDATTAGPTEGCLGRAEWTAALPAAGPEDGPDAVAATPHGPVVATWGGDGLDLLAYDTSGALRWQRHDIAPPGAESSLVSLDTAVYFGHGPIGKPQSAHLISLADGTRIWSGELGDDGYTPFYVSWVTQEGAADRVWVLPVVGTAQGWQATWLRPDGSFQPLGPASEQKPRPWTVTAEMQTVGVWLEDGSQAIGGYRFEDGKELWRIVIPAGHVVAGQADREFFVHGDGHLIAYRHDDGTEAWRILAAERARGAGAGEVVLVRDVEGLLRRVHPDDGSTFWETRLLPLRWGQDVYPPDVQVGDGVLLAFQTREDLGYEPGDEEEDGRAIASWVDVLDPATGAKVATVPYAFLQPPLLKHGMLADFVDLGDRTGYGVIGADGAPLLLCRPAEGGVAIGDLLPGRAYVIVDGRLLAIPL